LKHLTSFNGRYLRSTEQKSSRLSPVVSQCLLLCLRMSPIVSRVSPFCLPLSPIVSQCLPMSPIVSHCLLLCLPLSPVCLPRVSFLNSTVVTQSSISNPFVLRVSLLPTYLDVEGLSEFERMKTTGSDSVQKLIINGWGPGKTGESDKIAPVPGTVEHVNSQSTPTRRTVSVASREA
jgi:hypothetical protein